MALLTVFTPTYNRLHTITRTYESLYRQTCREFKWLIIDDGSTDGTRKWVKSLGPKVILEGQKFDWMGRTVEGYDENHFVIQTQNLQIEYIYKPNGGLYTGYNVAYQTIQTELCVCIDSDDFMPDDAVEKIVGTWNKLSDIQKKKYCGIEGLDFDIRTNEPIGGYFPEDIKEAYLHEIGLKNIHHGDTKQVMRTALMKEVAPMIGFEGERNFNPIYMLIKVGDEYPILITNDCYCIVEYQIGADSMSQGIFRQYVNSPRSFAKMRLQEITLKHNTLKDRFRSAVHYVSSCLIAKDKKWFANSPKKTLTLIATPIGILVYLYIKLKTL